MNILVAEDDQHLAESICQILHDAGYRTEMALDGGAALRYAQSGMYDLLLLDVMMPGMDGIAIARQLRVEGNAIPILMLTARDSTEDKVRGLDSGADDYLTKPFGVMELLSRIRALMRRTSADSGSGEELLESDGISLNTARHLVTVHDTEIILTGKEFDLLAMLMRNQGIVLSRERILESVWGYDYPGESRTVDVHIRTLRAKLGDAGNAVETVRGVGYRFQDHHSDTTEATE